MTVENKNSLQCGAIVLMLIGIVIRCYGSTSDLWLDELWSLGYALNAPSVSSILFDLKIDNNHIFNTLYLYSIGSVRSAFLYRILSLSSGMLALIALYREGSRKPEHSSWTILCMLLSTSFLVILYASEARGYGLMAFCLIISWVLIQRFIETPTLSTAIGFWIYAALGLFAQFSYALFFLGAPLWSLYALWKRLGFMQALRWGLILWLPVGLGSLLLYITYISHIPPGTGYLYSSSFEVLLNTVLLTFGLPSVSAVFPALGALSLLFWICTLCIMLRWIYQLFSLGDERWLYFISTLIIVPLFVVLVLSPRIFCTRYIFVVVLSFYWLFSIMLDYSRRGLLPSPAVSLWALTLIFVLGNLYANIRFLSYLRGKPESAISYIIQQSDKFPVSITADNDYRTLMMLAYYWPRVSTEHYSYTSADNTQAADWYLFQTRDQFMPVTQQQCRTESLCYCLEETFPFSAESGWEWRLYRQCMPKK